MQPMNDALSNAFQLLTSTVRDFYANGRPCLGAALKPILYRRANFNEQWLGFSKFGDFLRAAQAAGHVQLSPTPGGDIGVWPAGITIPERPSQPASGLAQAPPGIARPPATPTHSTAPQRVRQDLWNAFNSFTVSWVYDPVADIAQRESVSEAQGPARTDLVKIPASVSLVLEWMRSFAETQGPEIQAQMLTALNGDAAPYRFNNYVRSNRNLARAWRDFHVQKVLSAIESWAGSNALHPKNLTDPFYWSLRPNPAQIAPVAPIPSSATQAAPSTSPSAFSPSSLVDQSSLLTGRLESLIDELIDGLLKLRGFLQLVGPK